jgi:tryptophan 2,3-dioxygenase
MLRTLAPHDFQAIRTILGNGSGFESPGWRGLRDVGEHIARTFADLIEDYGTDLVELYTGPAHSPLYRLAEALLTLDERVSLWRVNHYKLAVRIIGNGTTGTKGTPVDALAKLINYKFFPSLWAVRTKLVRIGPMHGDEAGDQ